MQNAFDILEERGFLYQLTARDALRDLLARERVTFYVGFDPTGNSLHVGHLLPVMAMRWLQRGGHFAIALVGGGTAMIGDPSGKTEARPILTAVEISANSLSIQEQMSRFLDFTDDRATMVNNGNWLIDLQYIEFLRDIGRHFSVNRMLSAESVRQRLETGLSFLEFNYMLLQAYDFYVLRRDRNCKLQMGGQDQWGNIVAGVDLTRRMLDAEVYGATLPLLLKGDGSKFGKTASGAVWLDETRTSVYDYYQFWRNADDADVPRLLAFFTPLPMDEVRRLGSLPAPTINRAKEVLAFEATLLAHGEQKARQAYLTGVHEFGAADPEGKIETSSRVAAIDPSAGQSDLPSYALPAGELAKGVWVVKLFTDCGLCASNGAARRLIQGGGGYVNGERVVDDKLHVTTANLVDDQILLRAGKKSLRRIVLSS